MADAKFNRLVRDQFRSGDIPANNVSNTERSGGVICHMDDILIHAADQAEHDKRVRTVLGRIQEA